MHADMPPRWGYSSLAPTGRYTNSGMGVCSAHAAISLTSAANNQGFVTGAGGTGVGAGTGANTPGLGEGCG